MYDNKLVSRRDAVISGLALSLASIPAMAQTSDEESVEEVVVVGSYAQSLISALDRKRNADGVVDAITAEDIGKYPDTNLAESLARISGVSIDRFNGEGSRVTVRGLGPEYNLVTLNGRSMPTVGGRSFDFADISPFGIAAVEVYKTGNAAIPTGGIGSTVNMVTTKPLDAPGFVGVIDASLVDAYSVMGDDQTPQIMGIYSNTFADDTIGVSISASSQERDNREEKARVNTWLPNFNTGGIDPAVWTNNSTKSTTWYPQDADYQWLDNQTERTNAQVTIQWQASDDVRATVDYTHSKRDFFADRRSIGIWFVGGGNVRNAVTNENGTFTTVTEAGGDYASNMSRGGLINTNNSLGFNLEWNATDNLTVTFDAHDSSAEGKGAPEVGSDTFLITGNTCFGATACIGEKTATYPSNGVHIFNFTVAGKDEFEASDIGTLFGASSDYYSENDMNQMHLSALWENADSDSALRSIKFGYATAEQDWLNQNMYSGQLPAGWWLTSAEYAPDDMWFRADVGSILSDAANSGQGPTYYFGTTWNELIGFYEGFTNAGPDDWISCCNVNSWPDDYKTVDANGDLIGNINPGPIDSDARVKEETNSFYVQFNFETEFNGMPVDVVTGLRYESTDVTSSGLETPVTNIAWVGGNEFSYVEGEKGFTQGMGSNKFFLPSFDSKIGISDNEIVRFSYSRSISRPGIGNLRSTTDFVGNPQVNQRNAVVGNPGLMPYVADNLDLTYENYYAEGSYFAIGYWRKIVDNFLQTRITQESVNGIRDIYVGQAAEECRANGEDTDLKVYNCLSGGVSGVDLLPDGDDPLAIFNISRTVNEESGLLYGFEFAGQHLFGDGYGVTANFTTVNGDLEADREALDYQFALTGMNDSANLSGFYETDKYSVRLSWNWRDEFLGGFDQHSSPVYTEAYEQWDLNASYNVNDNFEVYAQGLNLTGETIRTYIRYKEQLSSLGQYGTTYIVGARYKF